MSDTWNACSRGHASVVDINGGGEDESRGLTGGTLYSGDLWGTSAVLCSLVTNIIATGLIAYRAWYVLSSLSIQMPQAETENSSVMTGSIAEPLCPTCRDPRDGRKSSGPSRCLWSPACCTAPFGYVHILQGIPPDALNSSFSRSSLRYMSGPMHPDSGLASTM